MDTKDAVEVVMVARSQTVDDLVTECASGRLPFSGADSLCAKVAAMGFSTNSLFEAVRARREAAR